MIASEGDGIKCSNRDNEVSSESDEGGEVEVSDCSNVHIASMPIKVVLRQGLQSGGRGRQGDATFTIMQLSRTKGQHRSKADENIQGDMNSNRNNIRGEIGTSSNDHKTIELQMISLLKNTQTSPQIT